MNTKRLICLALATLLALLPLTTLAAGEKYVKNTGKEPVGIFAAIGDKDPVRTLAPGKREKWLDEETVDDVLWYRVRKGFIMAGPDIEVVGASGGEPDLIAALTIDDPTPPPQEGTPDKLPEILSESHGSGVFDPARQGSGSEPTPEPILVIGDPVLPVVVPGPTATSDPGPMATTDPGPTATPSPSSTPAATPSSPEATPGTSPTASPSPTPPPGGASSTELVIDTAYVYPGMDESYADGYRPTVTKEEAIFVLPLLGDTLGDVVRVTPDISTSGPFVYGNYQFDLKKSAQIATDRTGREVTRQVFLIRLSLDLAKNRYNGTYPVTFFVSYTNTNGDPAEQTFTLQVTITNGKKPSSGGGGGGPTAVKKPVIVLESSEVSSPTIAGGEGFTLSLRVKNVGDLEAKNVRIAAASDGQGLYRSDSLAPLFLPLLAAGESADAAFAFASDKTVFAGRHGLTVSLSYEDKYGTCYGDSVPMEINVVQESSIGFDEMKLPETLTSGDTFTQPVCVYNTGYAPVYNVRCTLRMDGLIAASAFLGTLEPQKSADKAISVFVTTLPGKEKYGAAYGELVISYEDMAGQEHTEYQQLHTTVQAPVEITDEEKAKKEKEQKEQQTLSQWWVSLLVSIAFILIVLSVIVIARFSRMLKMK